MLKIPIFAALDVDDLNLALKLANQIKNNVGGFKIGPRLCNKYGELAIKELATICPVFVDLKFYDIPNTMLASVRQVFEAGASFATVHASCGKLALKKLAQLEAELSKIRKFKILAVTLLTSFDQSSLPTNQNHLKISEQVSLLAKDCLEAGISSLVCSSQEVSHLRELYPQGYLVTPGVRMPNQKIKNDDQNRVATPKEALRLGASALVVGRPIYAAQDAELASLEIFRSI